MVRDNFYIFDKTTFKRTLLGEIQSDFNMSFTIDGTKDSLSILVWSYEDVHEIEPYTICWHEKTNTWWIVSHDKIERYQNEQGFVYIHNLELLGAIDLLSARDLTDCGFNDNTYSVRQFIERLFSLSNIEYPLLLDSGISQNFLAQNVNFIKTFENYTLLSALREFLDAYNMCPKLTFDTTIVNYEVKLYYARLKIIPKTGNKNLTQHLLDSFDDARETKSMDKNSFGTCVISNAENVISSREKIYPSSGSVKLSSQENTIKSSNAILRLPSKVFKTNWIKMMYTTWFEIVSNLHAENVPFYPGNDKSVDNYLDKMYQHARTHYSQAFADALWEDMQQNKEEIARKLNAVSSVRFFDGNKLIPTFTNNSSTVRIEKGDDVPYLTKLGYAAGQSRAKMVFTDKETRNMLPQTFQGVYWERGSDIIGGFDFIQYLGYDDPFDYKNFWLEDTEYQSSERTLYQFQIGNDKIYIYADADIEVRKDSISFVVNYVPMSDIKIKVDNQRTKKDIQLYNQNGKITDNFALSKLINSYSKEISSDNIVRYSKYTDYNDIPKIGSIVKTSNGDYVINNISMTFYQNESKYVDLFNYYIDCEFNMSKAISTKSMMVSPNTNIRDYGIPQNFNVRRKQLYRDYYELNYNLNDDNEGDYYFDPSKVFVFGHESNDLDQFIAVMKITYDSAIGGDSDNSIPDSDNWYYQLETTNYYMNKMFYIMLDFKDNNIIGYGSQNVWSGFDVSRIFDGLTDTINIPISYVDDKGKAKGIYIKLASNEDLTSVYNTYQEEEGGSSFQNSLYNYSVFIPQYIYDNVDGTIVFNEENYNKDALEVPVFEYVCQVDDSDDVLVGDNIFAQYDGNIIYFYSFVIGESLSQDNVANDNSIIATTHPIGWSIGSGISIDYESFASDTKLLRIRFYNWQRWDIDTLGFTNGPDVDISQYEGKDIAIFRTAFDLSAGKTIADDLLFIAKKVPYTNVSQDGKILTLQLNHYKLK